MKLPIDYLAHPETDARLRKHLGAATENELLDALHCDFFFDNIRQLCDLAHSHGLRVMMHSCGAISELDPVQKGFCAPADLASVEQEIDIQCVAETIHFSRSPTASAREREKRACRVRQAENLRSTDAR